MTNLLGKKHSKTQQGGFAFMQILAMLGLGAILVGMISYGFMSTVRSGATVSAKSQNADTFTQVRNVLITFSRDYDADGIYEAPEMYLAASNCASDRTVCPQNGGQVTITTTNTVSTTVTLPIIRVDGTGVPIGYCVWDNSPTTTGNSSTGRLAGVTTASNSSADIVFALIWAGPNRTFDTSCDYVKNNYNTSGTVSLGNLVQGDDGIRIATQADLVRGAGGTVFYSDPVADYSKLPTVPTGNRTGEMRMTMDTMSVYVWTGSAWLPANAARVSVSATAGANCDTYPAGSLARDSSTGDLMICK